MVAETVVFAEKCEGNAQPSPSGTRRGTIASPQGLLPNRRRRAAAMIRRCARHQDPTAISRTVLEEAGLIAPREERNEADRLARECQARVLPPCDHGIPDHRPLDCGRSES